MAFLFARPVSGSAMLRLERYRMAVIRRGDGEMGTLYGERGGWRRMMRECWNGFMGSGGRREAAELFEARYGVGDVVIKR